MLMSEDDISNGNWEKYVPFGRIKEFFQLYMNRDLSIIFFSNKHNVITLIKKYGVKGTCIRWCSYDIQNDKDVAYVAVERTPHAIKDVSDELKRNKELAIFVVNIDGKTLEYLPYFQDDEDVVFIACKQNAEAIKFASNELQQIKAKKSNISNDEYETFEFLIDIFQDDKDFVLNAIEKDIQFIVSDRLKEDPDIKLAPQSANLT
jgi:hypothetical protein